jgi:asparagine synthase (glutamine-hydrolysing)
MSGILGFAGAGPLPATIDRLRAAARNLQHRDTRDQAIHPSSRSELLLALCSACDQSYSARALPTEWTAAMFVERCARMGRQSPGSREDQILVACDGVVDNLPELMQALKSAGCELHGTSQVEILQAAFSQWGTDCFPKIAGSFAFAVVDSRRRRLVLARDAFGTRPLYYTRDNGRGLFFASQIAALLELASLRPRVNCASLYRYLADNIMDHGAETFFAGVDQLPAGHYLEVSLETPSQSSLIGYRRMLSAPTGPTFDEAVEHLRTLVVRGVESQVGDHNQVGAALSGGFDSSFVVAAFKRARPGAALSPYTCVPLVKSGRFPRSEEAWAEEAAEGLGVSLKKVHVPAGGLPETFASLIRLQEEPFSSPVVFAQLQVFRAAAEDGVRLMLSGQGGDTMFATSPDQVLRAALAHTGGGRWASAAATLRSGVQLSDNGLQGLVSGAARVVMPSRWQAWAKRLRRSRRVDWLKEEWFELDPPALPRDRGLPMLRFEDRNATACAILNRMPLLTPDIQDFVASLPAHYLVRPDQPIKSIESAALQGLVPDAILRRKERRGFPVPIREWLVELAPWVDTNIEALKRLPFLEPDQVSQVWDSVKSGGESTLAAFLVWRWVFLAGWMEVFNVSLE